MADDRWQRLESRGRLEDEGTERTTTQVLNITQKVPETIIYLKVDGLNSC